MKSLLKLIAGYTLKHISKNIFDICNHKYNKKYIQNMYNKFSDTFQIASWLAHIGLFAVLFLDILSMTGPVTNFIFLSLFFIFQVNYQMVPDIWDCCHGGSGSFPANSWLPGIHSQHYNFQATQSKLWKTNIFVPQYYLPNNSFLFIITRANLLQFLQIMLILLYWCGQTDFEIHLCRKVREDKKMWCTKYALVKENTFL